jgi:hypothetical protein
MGIIIIDVDTGDGFDQRYIDNDVVEVVQLTEENGKHVHGMKVTEFGWDYCMGLIVALFAENNLHAVNTKERYNPPSGIIQGIGDGYKITQKGREWFKDYILSHKYDEIVYLMITKHSNKK